MAIDARQVQASGVYKARVALRTLFEDLDQIEKLLAEIAALRKKIRIIAGFSALAGIVFGIAGSALGTNIIGFLALLAFVLGLVLFIYSFVYGRALHRNRDRPAIMRDILKTIQRDADPRSPCAARLALAGDPKLLREEPWLARKNGKQRFFEEVFLSHEGELLDGTTLTETVTELTRKRTYRNPSGKIKTKTRKRYLVTVRVDYPNDVYGDAQCASAELNEQIRVPESATVRATRVTGKAIVAKATVDLWEDIAHTGAMLSLGAYRILNLARRTAASGSGGKP